MQPLLLKTGVATQDEADRLYEQAMEEMQSEDFCSLAFILTAWGQKPVA